MKAYGKNLIKLAGQQKATVAIIIMLIIMIFPDTAFYTPFNLFDMLSSVSISLIVAGGVTLVIICAGCDLSVGGVVSLTGITTIMLMRIMPVSIAILISLVIGTIIGFINGFFVVHQKNEPFVITFGMGILIKGIALQLTDARPIAPSDMSFMDLANTKIFGTIKILVLVMIVVLAILHYVLRYTQFGRNCYAVGGDYEVAVYAGINARRTKWAAFIISGFTAALAGIVLSSKQASGNPVLGDAIPLLVHCGAVIGGTSLTGGKGGIIQTFLGLLSLFLLWNVMSFLRVDGYIQSLVQGIVIASILWFDNFQAKRIRELV